MRKKIAILGGGMSSLAAAYHLTSLEDWRSRYEITVYQMGWRLGGKCASGRNLEKGWRIEEHGLHMLFGWYANTFEIIRGCYRELGRGDDLRRAFLPCKAIVAPEWIDERVVPWELACPGDGGEGGALRGAASFIRKLIAWMAEQLARWSHSSSRFVATPANEPVRETIRKLERAAATAPLDGAQVLRLPALAEQLVRLSDQWEKRDTDDQALLVFLIDQFRTGIADDRWWHELTLEAVDDEQRGLFGTAGHVIRRLRVLIDFCATAIRGLLGDLLWLGRSWFDLDDLDLRDWLRRWGANDATIDSAIVDAIYGSVFSSGSPGQPVGAGTILHAAYRARFCFEDASIYRPNGSLGDVLFAPLYQVLRRRGVRFEFFHRVDRLELSADRERIETIHVMRQAKVAGGGEYQPLLELPGGGAADCVWPSTPIWSQLTDAAAIQPHDLENWWDRFSVENMALHAGRDFDQIIFGISLGALEDILRDALESDPKAEPLRTMIRAVPTTQTQAMQLWFEPRDAPEWPGSLPFDAPVAIPYQMPFDTVADMRHILAHEPGTTATRLLYLCAPLPDDGDRPRSPDDREYPARQRARAENHAVEWMTSWAAPLLKPRSRQTGGSMIADDPRAWIAEQYLNVPHNPSDRYVLCPPGSVHYRLRADESGYSNLVLAGDWLKTAVSAGCLEAATMGGIQAAQAIDPAVPRAHGDWLPDRPPATGPALIIRDGDLVAQPPIAIPELEQVAFVLPADEAALERLCNRELNLAPHRRYQPLGPFVVFYAASLVNRVAPFGSAPELDFGFWVPVVSSPGDRIAFYTPYLWVDSGWALAAGRALFGFPKQLGELAFDVEGGKFSVAAPVLPRFGGTLEKRTLVEAVCTSDRPRRGPSLTSLAQLIGAGAPLAAQLFMRHGQAVMRWLAQTAHQPSIPMVFLKQIPGAGADRQPCYRAIIEADVNVSPGRRSFSAIEGPFELRVHEFDSHRIAKTLGLVGEIEPGGALRVRPKTQIHMRFAAEVRPGVEIWRDV